MFTGKAKEKFESFLIMYDLENKYVNSICATGFWKLSPSMQWGVIQDFADRLRYDLEVSYHEITGKFRIYIAYLPNKHHVETLYIETRLEARAAAIEKLNELINK